MSSEAQDWVKKATELRNEGRVEESIIAARRATNENPDSANAWWQLALSVSQKDGETAAVDHFLKTVELAPNFAYGWHKLGLAYSKAGLVEEAEHAWVTAVNEDSERTDSLGELLKLYRKRDAESDKAKLLETLEKLEAQNALSTYDLHSLAIAYHNKGEYLNAIPLYKRYLAAQDDQYGYYNIGLAYNQQSVSRDIDAIDAWRQSLRLDPEYANAKQAIDRVLPKLVALRKRISSIEESRRCLPEDQCYSNYINPYELLNLDVESAYDLDVKEIQRAKNALVHEIQLEEGVVSWMPGLIIDRSRVIQVTDDLFDEEKKEWHFLVFQNRGLLNFLSKGTVDLFLIDEYESPLELLLALEDPEGFAQWLSPKFASQYNQVFAKALESRNADLIEALLDGRRWVLPADEDTCFEAALRQCDQLLEPLKKIEEVVERQKTSLNAVKMALGVGNAGKILTLLPANFQTTLSEAAGLIRSISISTNNEHNDPDSAKAILALAHDFATRAPSVRLKIAEDAKTLDGIIQREKKDESFITLGDASYNITREGAEFAGKKLLASDVETVRWGLVGSRSGGIHTQEYSIVIGGPGAKILTLSWKSTNNHDKQRELFFNVVKAMDAYIMPKLIEKTARDLQRGGTIYVGGSAVTKTGVVLKSQGWFSTKEELCPWSRLESEIENGEVIISDKGNPKSKISLPLAQTDNAWVLHHLVKYGF